MIRPAPPPIWDSRVLAASERVSNAAIADFVSSAGHECAVVMTAPAGAGKTGFICRAVGSARRSGMRLAVGTPTNEQAFALVRRIAVEHPREQVTFVPANDVTLPDQIAGLANVRQVKPAAQANGDSLIVGTVSKLGDAFARGSLAGFDGLLIDEGYQTDAARYYAVGNLAPTHLLVGDGGQLNPFSTIDDPNRWRGLPEDPLQTAVGVLLRNHPRTPLHRFPITRRLDARAVPIVQAFYPNLSFHAAVLPSVRQLRLLRAIATDPRARLLDAVLDHAAISGWAHLELREAPVLTADPEMIDVIVELLERLIRRRPTVCSELNSAWTALPPARIAVGVSHNDQKDLLRASLDSAGHGDVTVDTANRLQGLEFDLVIAWHPLAGLPDPDPFHLDPGRLCVLMTRHRHACIVVGRAGDRALLNAIPPPTSAYLGWDPDEVLDGWECHRAIFDGLEPHRLAA